MHWTLDEVRALPMHEYAFLVDELNAEAEKQKR